MPSVPIDCCVVRTLTRGAALALLAAALVPGCGAHSRHIEPVDGDVDGDVDVDTDVDSDTDADADDDDCSTTGCDDGLYCNGIETCVERRCVAGDAPPMDDEIGCTLDLCDEESDRVLHLPQNGPCQDDLYCNGAERCDETAGCLPPLDPSTVCDDRNECTIDTCDEAEDRCLREPADRDGDGHVARGCPRGDDCDDASPLINPDAAEDCANGLDDDCDGAIDAEDPSCSSGDTCDDPFSVPETGSFSGSTEGLANDYAGTCAGSGPDAVYLLDVPVESSLVVDTIGSTYDTVLYVREEDCAAGAELVCDDDGSFPALSRVDLFDLPAGLYYLFVDAYGADAGGDYVINLSWAPVGCGNGFLEPDEECDDGNLEDADACSAECGQQGAFALGFAGGDENALVRDTDQLDLAASFTVELWFRQDVTVDGLRRLLLRKGGSAEANYTLWIWGDGTLLGGIYQRHGVASESFTVTSVDRVDDGVWHHAALTYDEATLRLYLDGALVGTNEGPRGSALVNESPLRLGRTWPARDLETLVGAIDEVRISSVARYELASSLPPRHLELDDSTVALFRFDEGSGSSSLDSGPSRLRVLINGCTWEPEE